MLVFVSFMYSALFFLLVQFLRDVVVVGNIVDVMVVVFWVVVVPSVFGVYVVVFVVVS